MKKAKFKRKSPGLNKLYDELAQAAINYGAGEKLIIRIPQHLPKRTGFCVTVRLLTKRERGA